MTSWLDAERIDWERPEPEELLRLLAGAYRERAQVVELATQSGLGPDEIPADESPHEVWQRTLELAAAGGRMRALAEAAMLHPDGDAWRGAFAELLREPAPRAMDLGGGAERAVQPSRGGAATILLAVAILAGLAALVVLMIILRG